MNVFVRIAASVGAVLVPGLAWAGLSNAVPEPGMFELLSLGGVVAVVIGVRNRRKK